MRGEPNVPASWRRILALGALWLAISSAVLLAPGCYGRNCEGGVETFGTDGGQGRMLNADTWESGAIDGNWLWFPRQRYYVFDIRAMNGRTPRIILPYLSAHAEPNKGGNFTLGGGNLALLSNALPNRIDIRNDSCSDYYLHLVVEAAPFPPALPESDDAGTIDAAPPVDDDAGNEAADAGDEAGL
jgi:hypothetical protein